MMVVLVVLLRSKGRCGHLQGGIPTQDWDRSCPHGQRGGQLQQLRGTCRDNADRGPCPTGRIQVDFRDDVRGVWDERSG